MSLSRRTSPHARRVIQNAFKELERAVAVPDARRFRDTTIQDVQKACESIENELGARGLLRNMGRLQPLLKGLECYGQAVQTLCQGTPYLPWIWAPIVVILKIGSDCIGAFETLVKAYSRIGKSLGRFEKLRNAFADDPDFQEIVAIFYRDIVKFHECAYKFVTVNGWKIFFRTTWGRFDRRFNAILENLDQHGELIDKEANTRNIIETQTMLKQLEAQRAESLEKVQAEEKKESAKQYQAILARLQVNEADQNSIWETLVGALRAGDEGTCAWILEDAKVASWLRERGTTRSLWLQGSAGTGKSVIAAHLARFRSLEDHVVVYHFCDDLYASSIEYDQILRSIIRQLLERSDDSTAYVYKALILERKALTVSTLETVVQELVSILSGSAQERHTIWIILDGVDACETSSLARCVALMDVMAMKDGPLGSAICKVLFTSRREPHGTQARKRSLVLLAKESSHIQASVQRYAVRRFQSPVISDRLSQLGIGMDEIIHLGHEIAAKADGMFLYARLIIDYLSKQLFRTSEDLRVAIQELPPELRDFYRKILSTIVSHLNPTSTESVKCVLHWIGFSKSPLKKMEILSAVTFSEGVTEVDRLVPSFFLQDCSAVLEEKCDKTIGFIHVSVKEFLKDPESPISITEEEADRQHRLAILACIASSAKYFGGPGNERDTHIRVIRGVFSLLNYASKHWTEYVLSYAETCCRSGDHDARCSETIECLANGLNGTYSLPDAADSQSLDSRLEYLENFPHIRPFVITALGFQSQQAIGRVLANISQETSTPRTPSIDPVSTLLQGYRDTVQRLLLKDCYPGVSREDFELFRAQAQTSLFTCRIRLCPRASLGFGTEVELLDHEFEHTKGVPCRVAGCQYPPFRSVQLLQNHLNKYHEQAPSRRTLRRVGEFRRRHGDMPVDLAAIAPSTVEESRKKGPLVRKREEDEPGTLTPGAGKPQNQAIDDYELQIHLPNGQHITAQRDSLEPQRTGTKGQKTQAQVPAAFAGAQTSFQLGKTSPHGQPMYTDTVKNMNLVIPPKRKAKANQAKQQPSQASTATPEVTQEPKPPAQTVFYCTEPDCEVAAVGFATEEAWQAHVQAEHIQPSEDPRKFPPPSTLNFVQPTTQPQSERRPQNKSSSYWSMSEINEFPALLRAFGTDWSAIANHMGSKTTVMVKNYFLRKKDGREWEEIAIEADEKRRRGEKRPDPPPPSAPGTDKKQEHAATLTYRPLAAAATSEPTTPSEPPLRPQKAASTMGQQQNQQFTLYSTMPPTSSTTSHAPLSQSPQKSQGPSMILQQPHDENYDVASELDARSVDADSSMISSRIPKPGKDPASSLKEARELDFQLFDGSSQRPVSPGSSENVPSPSKRPRQDEAQTAAGTGLMLATSHMVERIHSLQAEEKRKYQNALDQLWASFNSLPPDSAERVGVRMRIAEVSRHLLLRIQERARRMQQARRQVIAEAQAQTQQQQRTSTPQQGGGGLPSQNQGAGAANAAPAAASRHAGGNAPAGQGNQIQRVPLHIAKHLNEMTIIVPPQTQGQDVRKAQAELRNQYGMALMTMENARNRIQQIDNVIMDRRGKGTMKPDDSRTLEQHRKVSQKAHDDAQLSVENFRQQQEYLKAKKAQGGAGAQGQGQGV